MGYGKAVPILHRLEAPIFLWYTIIRTQDVRQPRTPKCDQTLVHPLTCVHHKQLVTFVHHHQTVKESIICHDLWVWREICLQIGEKQIMCQQAFTKMSSGNMNDFISRQSILWWNISIIQWLKQSSTIKVYNAKVEAQIINDWLKTHV